MSQADGRKKIQQVSGRSSSRDSGEASKSSPVRRNRSRESMPVQVERRTDSAKEADGVVTSGARWTFLTNHAHVLVALHRDSSVVLREVARQVGITERAVQRIIQDLEEGGFIRREKIGRQNRYHVREDLHLRHPIEAHRTIGDLLQLVIPQD